MKSKVKRIYVYEGKEYRVAVGQDVKDLPKKLVERLVSLDLVEVPKKEEVKSVKVAKKATEKERGE